MTPGFCVGIPTIIHTFIRIVNTPFLCRPNKNQLIPSVLGKRKRAKKPVARKKKKVKKSKKPKNQPSVASFFAKVKK